MSIDLLDGVQPGCVLVRFSRATGTIQNLLRYSTDGKLPEENWLVATGGGAKDSWGRLSRAPRCL